MGVVQTTTTNAHTQRGCTNNGSKTTKNCQNEMRPNVFTEFLLHFYLRKVLGNRFLLAANNSRQQAWLMAELPCGHKMVVLSRCPPLLKFTSIMEIDSTIDSIDDQSPNVESYFVFLPEELIVYIFSFLPDERHLCSASLVSKQWYRLSQEPLLWKHICIHKYRCEYVLDNSQQYDARCVNKCRTFKFIASSNPSPYFGFI